MDQDRYHDISPEMQDVLKRIRTLENEREKDLLGIRNFCSRPHQFPLLVGQGAPLESKTNIKYGELLCPLREQLKIMRSRSAKDVRIEESLTARKECVKKRRRIIDIEDGGDSDGSDKFGGIENIKRTTLSEHMGNSSSSAPDSNDDSSQEEFSGEESSKVQDVIEIEDSRSESDDLHRLDYNSNGESVADSLDARSNEGCDFDVEERSSVEEEEVSGPEDSMSLKGKSDSIEVEGKRVDSDVNQSYDNTHFSIESDCSDGRSESDSEEYDDDDDFDLEHYKNSKKEIAKVRTSKLTIAMQGFRSKISNHRTTIGEETPTVLIPTSSLYDPESITHFGETYHKRRCYRVSTGDNTHSIVGILHFLPDQQSVKLARCVLVVPFEHTILGMEDEDVNFVANYKPSSHVQVYQHVADLPVTDLKSESREVETTPSLIYEPQVPGNWQKFGFFYEKNEVKRCGQRKDLRVLDLFAGAGGMSIGYKNAGFKSVASVENDSSATQTMRANFKGVNVYEGCVNDFLKHLDEPAMKTLLGRIDHVHVSAPCQGFSGKNRRGGVNDLANNELSMSIVEAVKVTKCTTAVFENVLGMWRRKHLHYVKNITKELMKLGYQVRCEPLRACSYGDPQKRPRFFIFISQKSAPPPLIPQRTHGVEQNILSFVTVKEALSTLQNSETTLFNIDGKTTSLRPGEHGVVRLDPDGLAPAICASSVPPIHWEEDRCITVREAATLQSFPTDYVFHGDLRSQYRQVGNAVPVALATAVAQSVRHVLLYEYEQRL